MTGVDVHTSVRGMAHLSGEYCSNDYPSFFMDLLYASLPNKMGSLLREQPGTLVQMFYLADVVEHQQWSVF